MGTRGKKNQYFILECVRVSVLSILIGILSAGVVGVFTQAEYIQSVTSIFAFLTLLVGMYVKGMIQREHSSFSCYRKDILRIHMVSDMFIAVVESVFLGTMLQVAHLFPKLNASLHLLDITTRLAQLPVWHYAAFIFLLVLAVQAIVTFDFLCNRGMLQCFYNGTAFGGNKSKKEKCFGFFGYMGMTILLGLAVGIFTETSKTGIRAALFIGLAAIIVVFYSLAAIKVKNKEF